jgi:hypothetical protein
MMRTKAALFLVLVAAATAPAQLPKVVSGVIPPLAELVPDTVLAYAKLEDPIGDFEKLMGSGDAWQSPQRMSAKTRRQSEKNLKQADKEIGLQDGSMDSWMRSIGSIELALFDLDFGETMFEGPPIPDFVAVFESSLATDIYNQVAAMMVDRGIGARDEAGRMVMGVSEGFAPTFALYGGKVVVAGSQSRLDAVLAAAKGGTGNSLASNSAFRSVCGDATGPRVGFMRAASLLTLIRDRLSENQKKRMEDVIGPLGLTKLAAVGYREDGPNGLITMQGDGPVRLFQLLKGNVAAPNLLMNFPADTAFTFGHTADFGPHIRRIEGFLTSKEEFPFAMTVAGGLAFASAQLGIATETLLEPIKEGFAVAMVPDVNGRVDDERSIVAVAGVPAGPEAEKLIDRVKKAYAKQRRCEIEEEVVDGVRWIREKPGSVRVEASDSRPAPAPSGSDDAPPPVPADDAPSGDDAEGEPGTRVVTVRVGSDSAPTVRSRRRGRFSNSDQRSTEGPGYEIAYDGKLLVVGRPDLARRVLAAQRGKLATLASTGTFERLPPRATFYSSFSLKSMFSGSSDFGAALGLLKGVGAVGVAMNAEDDKLTVTYNRAPGQFINMMIGAGLAGDDGGDQVSAVKSTLNDIGMKTKAYREKNKKWPKSLADLGYEGGKAPTFPDEDGKPKPIVFLPPKADAEQGDWNTMLAYWECLDFGRIVLSTGGTSTTWSESRFQSALAAYNTPPK